MARKVFLSFLGTNYYIKTRYYIDESCKQDSKTTHFVQETTIDETCKNWSSDDKIFIFLTKDAEEKNWNSPAQKNHTKNKYTGLEKILKNLHISAQVEPIKNIPEGFSEQEIWEIFTIIINKLQKDDELYIDITHAFRFLPMLMVVLLNYAKVVFNIQVKHIYYGAFEKLGPSYKVEQINENERFAPIIDLVSFSDLQDWTFAANSFIKYGNVEPLKELSHYNLSDLNSYFKQIFNVRGDKIIKANKISTIKKLLKNNDLNEAQPFKILKSKISNRISNLKENSINNGFYAVQFCIEHDLTQQGMTLLEEFVITKVLEDVGLKNKYKSYRYRNAITKTLQKKNKSEIDIKILLQQRDQNDEKKTEIFKGIIDKVFDLKYKENITKIFSEFSEIGRNDINHAGFRDSPKDITELKKLLSNSFNKIKQLFNL